MARAARSRPGARWSASTIARSRALADALGACATYRANYNKTGIEDVFKRHRFDAVLHLGRVGNLKESIGKRFDLNVVGSQKIMNLCVQPTT